MKLTFTVTLHVRQEQEDASVPLVPFDQELREALAEAIDRNLPSAWVIDVKNADGDLVVIENADSVVEVAGG